MQQVKEHDEDTTRSTISLELPDVNKRRKWVYVFPGRAFLAKTTLARARSAFQVTWSS